MSPLVLPLPSCLKAMGENFRYEHGNTDLSSGSLEATADRELVNES